MKSELKEYIKFVLQNHMDTVIHSYVEYVQQHKEYDIREIQNHELDFFNYYKVQIRKYLRSVLDNKVEEEVQNKLRSWENYDLSSSQKFYPILPQDLILSYTKIHDIMLRHINKYTSDNKKRHYIHQELERIDLLIDKIIIDSYRQIILNN